MFSLFKKFKDGLSRSAKTFIDQAGGIFGLKKLDASSIETLEEALYGADFGVETTEEIIAEVQQAYRKDKELKGQEVAKIGAAILKRVLEGSEGRLE
ncbi:MAG: signal recognition particle receptor subunit alpha, partial [Opitutaceae bacterium]|nr:signal recognition particle receptor subunit alpha [Opitutaceae bacterium]